MIGNNLDDQIRRHFPLSVGGYDIFKGLLCQGKINILVVV